jgi:hypothetical protein
VSLAAKQKSHRPQCEVLTTSGRPVAIFREGKVIQNLV